MSAAELITRIASELALFSGVGFLLFALNDLAIDCIYFGRRIWRSATIYRKYPRAFGETFARQPCEQGFIAVFVPAWDESAVIGPMLQTALSRIDYQDYRIFVGHYRNLWLLLWRIAMRVLFTTSAYGMAQGIVSVPRLVVGNLIAICAAFRALGLYLARAPQVWDKTRHTFPKELRT